LAAEVCVEQGLTVNQVSLETIRQALKKLGVGWQRAKHWITSPDPEYVRKKQRRDALIALAKRYGWEVGRPGMRYGGAGLANPTCIVGVNRMNRRQKIS
jgi:hypothetical protein